MRPASAYHASRRLREYRRRRELTWLGHPASSLGLQNLRDVVGDSLFEVARLGVEGFEFLVNRFELFLKVFIAHGLARSHTHVASGVERPALRFDLLERGGPAQTGHVSVLRLLDEDLLDLPAGFVAA